MRWASAAGTSFDHDYLVSFAEQEQREGATYDYRPMEHPEAELPGMSVFAKDADSVVCTRTPVYSRGIDALPYVRFAPARTER